MSTMRDRRRRIIESLKNKEYRDGLANAYIDRGLAFQIRAMQEDRGWTQKELGDRVGMAQGTISNLENPNYGRHTLSTLKRLASALDVALMVRFVPYSQLVDWIRGLSAEDMAVPSFDNDVNLGRDGTAGPTASIQLVGSTVPPSPSRNGANTGSREAILAASNVIPFPSSLSSTAAGAEYSFSGRNEATGGQRRG